MALRKVDGKPAAGNFPQWPDHAKDLRIFDPCCGAGVFLASAFHLLLKMRMAEEGLTAAEAGDAVIRDNLFGVDIDARCVQIAIFTLTIEAWKTGGYRKVPEPNIACCGLSVGDDPEKFTAQAGGDPVLEERLGVLYEMFRNAGELGSLINPRNADGSLK